jgi:hypothetical protein
MIQAHSSQDINFPSKFRTCDYTVAFLYHFLVLKYRLRISIARELENHKNLFLFFDTSGSNLLIHCEGETTTGEKNRTIS